jgi:hypothetical protein
MSPWRLRAGDRRRRSSGGSWGDLRTLLEPGHYEKLIGTNPATKWSPELAPVRTSAAVHGGVLLGDNASKELWRVVGVGAVSPCAW